MDDRAKTFDEQTPDPAADALLDYLNHLDAGGAVDREAWLDAHPDHRAELECFLEVSDQFHRLLPRLAATLVVDPPSPDATLPLPPGRTETESPDVTLPLPPGRTEAESPDVTMPLPPGRTEAESPDVTMPLSPGSTGPASPDVTLPIPPGHADVASRSRVSAPPSSAGAPVLKEFADYEILGTIARGGMGVVYLARQKKLNRVVALKMILAGQFADQSEIDRFYAEAEAAANLRHPHIVAVHDIGQWQGQHYFSMDYIEGKSLADMTRDQPLQPRQAAEYVRCIAETMQFAHERGVLHRDLKPSNILVDKHDEPLVTDFGLAKQMSGESQLTVSGAIVGTPSYMPPEQAAGRHDQVGPCSDIYSLGAILYELLTGRPPFRAATPFETIRLVLQNEPVSPRLVIPTIPRDLETICLKCLQKEPSKRYATAQELADELARFLRGEPIKARPISMAGRAWRWCRRNPGIAIPSAVAALFLVIALAASVTGWIYTSAALRESEISFRQALQVVNVFFTRVSEDTLLNQPGMQPLRRDLLKLALDYYHRLAEQRKNDPTLQDELGGTYFRIGVITELLESPAKALPWYEQARELQQKLLDSDRDNAARLMALGNTLNALGTTRVKLRELDKALACYQQAIELRQKLVALTPGDTEAQRVLANTYMNLGLVHGDLGDLEKARQAFEEAQKVRLEALHVKPDDPKLRRDLAKGYYNLGSFHLQQGYYDDAASNYQRAADEFTAALKLAPDDLEMQMLMAVCYRLLGDLASAQGEFPAARLHYAQAAQSLRKLADANPGVTDYRVELAGLMMNVGSLEQEDGRAADALRALEGARELLQPLVQQNPQVPRFKRDLAVTLKALAQQYHEQHDRTVARAYLEQARELLDTLRQSDPDDGDLRAQLDEVQSMLRSLTETEAAVPTPPSPPR